VTGIGRESRLAVLGPVNLSSAVVEEGDIRTLLRDALERRGLTLLDDDALDRFMTKHRMRYTGGLSRELGRDFRSDAAVDAVLVTTVDLYDDTDPPKFALTSRLVAAGEQTSVVWMDSEETAGDESPGVLGLGQVHDFRTVADRVVGRIADSLVAFLDGRPPGAKGAPLEGPGRAQRRFRPKTEYGAPFATVSAAFPTVAVLPFMNDSPRKHAGELLMLQFVRGLISTNAFDVVEPGVVRQVLLQARLIMERGGVSLAQADLLRTLLNADLVLIGSVTEYNDYQGPSGVPRVSFSVRGIDANRRQVVWSSISYNRGDDGVYFFNVGRVYTAQAVAHEMVHAAVERIVEAGAESSKVADPGRGKGKP
jgi:hypothetical protein